MRAVTSSASLAGGLAATFGRNVPAVFFSEAARARISAVGSALPGAATDFFGFECRLGGAAPESDFAVCIERGDPSARLAAHLAEHPPGGDPFWAALARYCHAWNDPADPDGACVHNIWLEFDLAGVETCEAVPIPSVFVGTERLEAGTDPSACDAACTILDRLAGAQPSPHRRQALRNAFAALPPGGELFQLGLMLSRSDARIRICAKGMTAGALTTFLARLGYSDAGAVAPFVAEAAAHCAEIRAGFDVGPEGIGSRLGLECYCTGEEAEADRWPDFARFLLGHGLALPAEVDALTNWTALIHRRLLDGEAADWLDGHPSRPDGAADSGLYRTRHHVKLTLEQGRATSAKAYLAAQPVWLAPGHLAALIRGGAAGGSTR